MKKRKLFRFVLVALLVICVCGVPTIAKAATCSTDYSMINQALTNGANRLRGLQQADGGWQWYPGSGTSAQNIFGVTALGLLSAYSHTRASIFLDAATETGDALVAKFNGQNPKVRPYTADVEFLVALSNATANPTYANTAQSWFAVIVSDYPNPSTRVDAILTGHDSQGYRSMAAWDVASLIRAAKAAGNIAYASGVANRIIAREVDIVENGITLKGWKDTDPNHRWDQCANQDGCGQTGNLFSFDYTLLGEGSLLISLQGLTGYDTKIDEYRSFLLSQQEEDGTWDVADSQITSYVVMGLSTVGGSGVNDAICKASGFFVNNQFSNGGWPIFVPGGSEITEIDSEIMQAIAGSALDSGILGNWHWCNGNDYNFLDDHKFYKDGVIAGTWALTDISTRKYTVTWNAGWVDVLILSSDGLNLNGTNQYGDHVTATRNASNCLATMVIDSSGKLSLKIPYLSDVIPMLGTQYLEVEFAYVFNPTLLLFELTKYNITQSPSFCEASTLSSDLKIHIPDLLLPDGITHYWVNLEYSAALSTDGNAYFVITNYGDVSN